MLSFLVPEQNYCYTIYSPLVDVPEITVTSHEEAEEAWKELAQQVEANTYKAKMKIVKKKAKKAKVKYFVLKDKMPMYYEIKLFYIT